MHNVLSPLQFSPSKMDDTLQIIYRKLKLVSKNVPGMAVCIITKKDNLEVYKTYGYSNLEDKVPISLENKWCIQSICKHVNATVAAWLVGRNKASFNSNVFQVLKEKGVSFATREANETITIKHCLSMSSGLPKYTGESPALLFQQLSDLYKTTKYYPLFPKTTFQYTNMGYTIGFDAISTQAGYSDTLTPVYEFAKIIDMPIYIYPQDQRVVLEEDVVLSYVLENNTFVRKVLPSQKVFIPADGIVCTIKSLAMFMKFHLNNDQTIIPKKALNEIRKPIVKTGIDENLWYGIGSEIYEYIHNGSVERTYGHAGGYSEGLTHQIVYSPKCGAGVIVLTNTFSQYASAAAYYTYFALTMGLEYANLMYDRFFSNYLALLTVMLRTTDLSTIAFPTVQLSALTGLYYNQTNGYVSIFSRNGNYYAKVGKSPSVLLRNTLSIQGTIETNIGHSLLVISPVFASRRSKDIISSIQVNVGGDETFTYVKFIGDN